MTNMIFGYLERVECTLLKETRILKTRELIRVVRVSQKDELVIGNVFMVKKLSSGAIKMAKFRL